MVYLLLKTSFSGEREREKEKEREGGGRKQRRCLQSPEPLVLRMAAV